MKSLKINIILSVITLLFSIVTVSYAWMNIEDAHKSKRYIDFELTNNTDSSYSIQKVDLSCDLSYKITSDATYTDLPSNSLTVPVKDNMFPGDYIYYKLDFTNGSEVESKFSIGFSGITTSYTGDLNPLDYFDLEVQRITGLTTYPPLVDVVISSGIVNGKVMFYTGFIVPANTTISIYFTLQFIESAPIDFEGISLTLEKLVIASL